MKSIKNIDNAGNIYYLAETTILYEYIYHREDGPAFIHINGDKIWYINNKIHRLDGPAVIRADGTQFWYVDDKLHRIDGPAVIRADGSQGWYVDGKDITDEVEEWLIQNNYTYPFNEEVLVDFKLRVL